MAEGQTQEAPAPVEQIPASTEAAEPVIPTDESSLSEHEAAFGPIDPGLEGDARKQAEEARTKIRHRAKSQQASPEDVPRIKTLTRVAKEWQEKYEALEARVKQTPVLQEQAQSPAQPQPQPAAREQQQSAPTEIRWDRVDPETGLPEGWVPTRPEPTEDEVGTKYANYSAMTRAQSFWANEQIAAANRLYAQYQQQATAQTQAQQAWQQAHQAFTTRAVEFAATHADYDDLIAKHPLKLPDAPYTAILKADNGPAMVYHLLQHPDQLAEMLTIWDGKPDSDHHVANATRWLTTRMQAGTTGSAAPASPTVMAPRPPNPVRTGPLKTGDELPGDEGSLAEHERAFGGRRNRR